ncbi:hypothetical protein NDU88_003781 [Pleurodeles waltl]|uniref:Uncharacterized protein n=1 Tax=Pleurodeles waltl TaxID=8319 RepID=A0AAV7MRL0_PLEWA|nr:hypothetical protein NDU88_003781 [Pleurodeles waltl]
MPFLRHLPLFDEEQMLENQSEGIHSKGKFWGGVAKQHGQRDALLVSSRFPAESFSHPGVPEAYGAPPLLWNCALSGPVRRGPLLEVATVGAEPMSAGLLWATHDAAAGPRRRVHRRCTGGTGRTADLACLGWLWAC